MNFKQLSARVRKEYRKLQSYRAVAAALNITTAAGMPNPGLALQIARGIEPRSLEVRKRLGLTLVCPTCERHITAAGKIKVWHRLDDLTPAQIKYIFDHRQDM